MYRDGDTVLYMYSGKTIVLPTHEMEYSIETIELLSALVIASSNVSGSRIAVAIGSSDGVREIIKKHVGVDVDCSKHVVVDGVDVNTVFLLSSAFRHYAYVCSNEDGRVVVGIAYRC